MAYFARNDLLKNLAHLGKSFRYNVYGVFPFIMNKRAFWHLQSESDNRLFTSKKLKTIWCNPSTIKQGRVREIDNVNATNKD